MEGGSVAATEAATGQRERRRRARVWSEVGAGGRGVGRVEKKDLTGGAHLSERGGGSGLAGPLLGRGGREQAGGSWAARGGEE